MVEETIKDTKVIQFFFLLVSKNRISLLPLIKEGMKRELLDLKNEIEVYVIAASKMENQNKDRFIQYLKSQLGKEIKANFTESNRYLGGFYAKVRHTVYDGTLDNSLNNLKLAFKN